MFKAIFHLCFLCLYTTTSTSLTFVPSNPRGTPEVYTKEVQIMPPKTFFDRQIVTVSNEKYMVICQIGESNFWYTGLSDFTIEYKADEGYEAEQEFTGKMSSTLYSCAYAKPGEDLRFYTGQLYYGKVNGEPVSLKARMTKKDDNDTWMTSSCAWNTDAWFVPDDGKAEDLNRELLEILQGLCKKSTESTSQVMTEQWNAQKWVEVTRVIAFPGSSKLCD